MCIKYGVGCCLLSNGVGTGNTLRSDNSGSFTLFLCPGAAAFQFYRRHKQLSFLNKQTVTF